jgi:dCMP deaminase
MRDVPTWDEYFMNIADAVALRSKDPETQVGAVLTKSRQIVSTGFNGFIAGFTENDERWQRPTKYDYVVHAEINAIGTASRIGIHIFNATMYVNLFPCPSCCRSMVTAGIREIVYDEQRTFEYFGKVPGNMMLSNTIVLEGGANIRGIRKPH